MQTMDDSDLTANELVYKTVFNNITEEIHFWKLIRDEEGNIKTWELVDANPPTLKTWGVDSVDKIIGKTTDQIFGPNSTEHYMPVVLKVFKDGIPYSYEDYFPNLKRYFRFTTVPLGDYFITTGSDITDLKKMQDDSERIRAELQAVFESVQDAIIVYNLSGEIVYTNKASLIQEFFKNNIPPMENFNDFSNAFDVFDPEGNLLNMDNWSHKKLLKGKIIADEAVRLVRKSDGREWYLNINGTAVKNKDGKQILALVTYKDLTKSKLNELSLKASEERFHTLADNISQLVWMADAEGNRTWFNKRFYEFTGKPFEELKGQGWQSLHHPETAERTISGYHDSIRKVTLWEDTFQLMGKDGHYKWFLARAVPVTDEKGNIVHWFGTNTDITDEITAHMELQDALIKLQSSEAWLINAQKIAGIGNYEADLQENKLYWSEGMYKIFDRDISLGPPGLYEAMHYVHPEDRPNIQDFIAKAKEGKLQIEYRIITHKGEVKYLYQVLNAVLNDKGEQIRRIGTVMDITERKLIEIKLQETLNQLKERLEEKEFLLKEIHHRIKNNMQIMSSLINIRGSKIPDQAYQNIFTDMKNRIMAMALVHEKLYQSPNFSKISLNNYIKDLVNLLLASHLD
jgi:PAS domain S-box-containing protein